jgi:hypothetical protein
MKRKITLLAAIAAFTGSAFAQMDTIVFDQFTDMSKFHDLTTTFIWGPNNSLTTGFQLQNMADGNSLSYDAISLTQLAADTKKYNIDTGLKEATAWDYEFPATLDRAGDTIVIEFDVLWKDLTSSGNTHRFVVAICHEYPAGGPEQDIIDSVNMEAPFGRPGYNFRILGRSPAGNNNYANVFYGGGHDVNGEFERYGSNYWIPGFISGPGGVSPEGATEYPEGPVVKWMTETISPLDAWHHFKMTITETFVRIYEHPTNNPGSERLVMDLFTPTMKDTTTMISELNTYYSASITDMPDLYNYFDNFKAVRFFFNGPDTHIANVLIKSTHTGVGIDEQETDKNNLIVYPSPTDGILYIKNASKTIRIYSISGKKVLTVKPKNGSINISSLVNGVYLVESDNRIAKIVKK